MASSTYNNRDSYRPSGRDRDDYRDRNDYDDDWFTHRQEQQHPRSRSPRYRRSPPPTMYQFSGHGDNYRPQERDDYRAQERDNYRAQDRPASDFDFNFRSDRQARFPPVAPAELRAHRNNRNNRGGRSNGHANFNQRKPWGSKPQPANDRTILHANIHRQSTPERLLGMSEAPTKFKDLDVKSDTELDEGSQKDMEISDNDATGPSTKRAKPDASEANGSSIPKWSNPDPYSVLPPVEEPREKKKDVVDFIRKAKLAAEEEKQKNKRDGVADNVDFISFDDEENDSIEILSGDTASTGTTSMRGQVVQGSMNDSLSVNAVPSTSVPFSHLSNLHPSRLSGTSGSAFADREIIVIPDSPEPPKSGQLDSGTLAQRANLHEQPRNKANKRKRLAAGEIGPEWQSISRETATPWCITDHSQTGNMGDWLHKEIIDFYDFVRPQSFEATVRQDLVDRVRSALYRRFPNARLHHFGSFAAGIYLPTADMDLCLVSHSYADGGPAVLKTNYKGLYSVMDCLTRSDIADTEGQQIVHKARVPIIKFIDKVTGLQVDISFENLTGVIAIKTFQDWKEEFPAMPVLVTLVKQLLLMRGLNEVHTGGLGGFSATCLVVSFLQLHPNVQTKYLKPEEHLGQVFMEFLDFYGNHFNMRTTGICLNPPSYFPKENTKEKWSLSDPNTPGNDISGGTSLAPLIAQKFSEAHTSLVQIQGTLRHAGRGLRQGQSLLGPVFGGNYESFRGQRDALRHRYDRLFPHRN